MSVTVLGVPGTVPKCELTRVYVWELPVRAAHWGVALSLLVLGATGLYIAHPLLLLPSTFRDTFSMGLVRTIHLYAATVFGISVVTRIVWMFMGNKYSRWDKFIPVRRKRWAGLLPTIRFYLFGLRKPPGFVGHNPLAGLAYTAVFALYILQMMTGFALYSAMAHVNSPFHRLGFLVPLLGGLQTIKYLHHVVMWLLLGFVGHHIYSAVLMSTVEANGTVESMFSGHKFVRPEDLVYSGYRFKQRRELHARSQSASDSGSR
jgi:Ni/Fe-hydrogenase 1 B-type cytochrome subunit